MKLRKNREKKMPAADQITSTFCAPRLPRWPPAAYFSHAKSAARPASALATAPTLRRYLHEAVARPHPRRWTPGIRD